MDRHVELVTREAGQLGIDIEMVRIFIDVYAECGLRLNFGREYVSDEGVEAERFKRIDRVTAEAGCERHGKVSFKVEFRVMVGANRRRPTGEINQSPCQTVKAV